MRFLIDAQLPPAIAVLAVKVKQLRGGYGGYGDSALNWGYGDSALNWRSGIPRTPCKIPDCYGPRRPACASQQSLSDNQNSC